MEASFLQHLNPPQREAVLHPGGPLLVFAGAGSGKTRVVTFRIAYLIKEREVSPHRILAVTFTNKAAAEMKRRVVDLLGPMGEGVWVSTFHSLCSRILRRHISHLGYTSQFAIYDEHDQLTVLKDCVKASGLDPKRFDPQRLRARIDWMKNQDLPFPPGKKSGTWSPDSREEEVFQGYHETLRRNNALDFGDLIRLTKMLFLEKAEVLKEYQELFQHLLVDEYQDTNPAQCSLILALASAHRNICVVGDDDQSIYRWRGAEVQNILEFERHFPKASVVTLDQNYRSTQMILDVASSLIRHNIDRKPKTLWTEKQDSNPVVSKTLFTEYEEAEWIADEIYSLRQQEGLAYGDTAVFYRIHAQSRVLEEALLQKEIPFIVVGGIRFYERKEIKDLLAYLRVLVNPVDWVSLKRILNVPQRGIGVKTLQKIEQFLSAHPQNDLLDSLEDSLAADLFSPALRKRLKEFVDLLKEIRSSLDTWSPGEVVEKVLLSTGYLRLLEQEGTVEAESRLENIREFLSAVKDFEEKWPEEGLLGFLSQSALVQNIDVLNEEGGGVSLMTLHNAKGLEFEAVFISGLE